MVNAKKSPRPDQEAEIARLKEQYLFYYGQLLHQKRAAGFIGRDDDTIINWRKADPDFADAVAKAKSDWALSKVRATRDTKFRFYLLADVVRDHKLSIPCATPDQQETIVEELEQIKGRDVEKDGKLKIVDKEEIKQNIGRSPDYADAISMRCFFDIQPAPIEFYMDSF